MTQIAKGSAEAATSTPSQVQTQTKGFENMDRDSTLDQEAASLRLVNEFSKEISEELNNIRGYHLVIIRPSQMGSYPVSICLDNDFAEMLKALKNYRAAWTVFSAARPRTKAYREAQFALFKAKKNLHATFEEREAA